VTAGGSEAQAHKERKTAIKADRFKYFIHFIVPIVPSMF
jgi:hypothetical protein